MKEEIVKYKLTPNYKVSKDIKIMYKDKEISSVCVGVDIIKVNGFKYDYKTKQFFNEIKKEQIDKITEEN